MPCATSAAAAARWFSATGPDGSSGSLARTNELLARVLPRVAPLLPVAIPMPMAALPASPALPHGALVYGETPGIPASPERLETTIAHELCDAFVALHAIDPGSYPGIPRQDTADEWRALWDTVRPTCAKRLPAAACRTLDAWRDRFLAAPEPGATGPRSAMAIPGTKTCSLLRVMPGSAACSTGSGSRSATPHKISRTRGTPGAPSLMLSSIVTSC